MPPISITSLFASFIPTFIFSKLFNSSLLNSLLLFNISFTLSILIPHPVSSTVMINLAISYLFIFVTFKSTYPSFVYLKAFVNTVFTICFNLTESPYNSFGILSGIV